jgi:hypothetical protein
MGVAGHACWLGCQATQLRILSVMTPAQSWPCDFGESDCPPGTAARPRLGPRERPGGLTGSTEWAGLWLLPPRADIARTAPWGLRLPERPLRASGPYPAGRSALPEMTRGHPDQIEESATKSRECRRFTDWVRLWPSVATGAHSYTCVMNTLTHAQLSTLLDHVQRFAREKTAVLDARRMN